MHFDRFDALYAIMQESFASYEHRTREGQHALLQNPRYRLRTAMQGDQMIGFIAFWELETCRYIEHVATLPDVRGHGIGGRLVRRTAEQTDKTVILEIEPPVTDLTIRRANFYRRMGFVLNDFFYQQLPLRTNDPPTELKIVSFPQAFDERSFRPLRREIYREVYGANT